MSDPLSIAAGVVGILTAAAQISSLLIKFTKATKDAPQQARVIVTEVNDTSGILSHLQSFLLGNEFSDRSRTSLLKVDQVVTIVSGCVLTFSELEKLLDELGVASVDVLDRMKWARKETAVAGLIQRLQNHKASLSLMLNILNGLVLEASYLSFPASRLTGIRHTIAEAKDSVDQLYALVQSCYQEMSSRVQALELRESDQIDMKLSMPEDDAASVLTMTQDQSNIEQSPAGASSLATFDFTDDLQKSWVYRRNEAFRESGFSVSTSSMYCSRWSVISGLSMAEVSTISIFDLPIASEEVYNAYRSSQTWSNERSDPIWPLQAPAPMSGQAIQEAPDEPSFPCKGCGEILEEGKCFELGK